MVLIAVMPIIRPPSRYAWSRYARLAAANAFAVLVLWFKVPAMLASYLYGLGIHSLQKGCVFVILGRYVDGFAKRCVTSHNLFFKTNTLC